MLLQVFVLRLIAAYASDFLTLVVDATRIPKSGEFSCVQSGGTLWTEPLWDQGKVPTYRGAADCDPADLRFDDAPLNFEIGFAAIEGLVVYLCAAGHTRLAQLDEVCRIHHEGTAKSLHVVYKGAKMGDKVVLNKGQGLEFGFPDIYDGREMSYGNFVGVFSPITIRDKIWNLAVGSREDPYSVATASGSPGTNWAVLGDKTLRSYFSPHVPADSTTPENAFILSVGVFGTLSSHHLVQSCVKGAPDGHCVHSKAITFTEGGSDMLVMALPNDMETYYFEYTVSKLSSVTRVSYDRIIYMTSVVKRTMIDSFQKRVFFSNEVAGGMFAATNLRRCNGAFNMCIRDDKKSFRLTFLGYTTTQQVLGLKVHGGEISVVVVNGDCVETTSQCAVTVDLFAYRNTQMWIEDFKDTHNGMINPYEEYQAMVFQGLTVVIEPAD